VARIRTIKPEFFKDEKVADLDPEVRLLFIGLWTLADRKGILEDRPRWIKAELFPYQSDFDITLSLLKLAQAKMCIRYTADDGSKLIFITNFLEHQRPNNKEPVSNRPLPSEDDLKALALENLSTLKKAEGEGEGKGNGSKDGKGNGEKTLSGKPDVSLPGLSKATLKEQALEVLNHLNRLTGKAYEAVDANLDLIAARLKEGRTVGQLKQVNARKYHDWVDDEKMVKYLRPLTLYNKSKCAQYVGECVIERKPNELS
jgi:uncharacterized phage protein (TIGR02220 family)